jgi:hypothetical protein
VKAASKDTFYGGLYQRLVFIRPEP